MRIGTTTIRALNLIMRSLLVPSSLAIGRIVCVVQAIAMTVGWLGISTSLWFDKLYFSFFIRFILQLFYTLLTANITKCFISRIKPSIYLSALVYYNKCSKFAVESLA